MDWSYVWRNGISNGSVGRTGVVCSTLHFELFLSVPFFFSLSLSPFRRNLFTARQVDWKSLGICIIWHPKRGNKCENNGCCAHSLNRHIDSRCGLESHRVFAMDGDSTLSNHHSAPNFVQKNPFVFVCLKNSIKKNKKRIPIDHKINKSIEWK